MNILVVDDDRTNRELLRVKLEREGQIILEAADGAQALAVLDREAVDAIISDILMPHMDGYRLCVELRARERFCRIPFVVYTNIFTSPADERLASEAGADRFFKKSATADEILTALRELAKNPPVRRRAPVQPEPDTSLMERYSRRLVEKLEEKNAQLLRQTEELARARDFYLTLLDDFPTPIWRSGVDGRCDHFNRTWLQFTGRRLEEELGDGWAQGVHPEDLERVLKDYLEAFHARRPFVLEYRLRRHDGEYRSIVDHGRAYYDLHGQFAGYIGSCYDVTDRKRAEEEGRRSEQQLRALAAHLQAVREEERTRISRQIHDELGQMLTGLKMDLRWIERKLTPPLDDARRIVLEKKIIDAAKLTDATIETVQNIAAELRPSVLDNLGLIAAIHHEATRFGERTGIHFKLALPDELPGLDRHVATALFRVLQEILTNVGRHAGATAVEVRLGEEYGELVLVVKDNGKGISSEAVSRPTSLGLLGMSERSASVAGRIYFQGAPGSGTTVTVRIPQTRPKTDQPGPQR